MDRRMGWLLVTIVLAVVVFVATGIGLVTLDSRTTAADALRTAGFAAGSIVALYALWLNDRRRRVAEQRQEVERAKADLDRDRVADERFARAVELLGSDAEQVRVGALHALAGLARSNTEYTQTVIDVLCSYLQQPFLHPRHSGDKAEWTQQERHEADRKLSIRMTAQRLLSDLLPATGEKAPKYDLDLTRAALEYFELSQRQIGRLILRYARLYSSTKLNQCEIHGPVWFTGIETRNGRTTGNFTCSGTVFHDRTWFREASFAGRLDLSHSTFHGAVKFWDSSFHGTVLAEDTVFHGQVDLGDTTFSGDLDLSSVSWPETVITTGMAVDRTREVQLPQEWQGTDREVIRPLP